MSASIPCTAGLAAAINAEHRLKFANSYTRAAALLKVFRERHPRRLELLGEEWSGCDYYPAGMRKVVRDLPRPTWPAMDDLERYVFGNLPAIVTVFRGCYQTNRAGFSWSTSRDVAERFPTLMRYRQPGQPLLIEGRVRRERIAFLKLDRSEEEVVVHPDDVEVVGVVELRAAA